ncbi:MAG: DUF2911 domain-containing protein [Acidobacteriota bacterium]|nr:DUF2911 domain-containing protein [Acidobacteriota bacterium]
MKIIFRNTVLSTALLALACATSAAYAQAAPVTDHGVSVGGKPLASPAATATATLDGKSVTINYNAPSLRGRKMIGGENVPYGKVWRTGANPATTLITAADLKIGTLDVPAGTYTIYSIPEAHGTAWQLIVNKQTGQWGTVYKQDMDLGRTPMTAKPIASPQEKMSISFEHVHGKSAELHIRWADVDESVKVVAK